MKKIMYLLITLLVISCGSTKTESNVTATPKYSKKTLKGTWEVKNIRFVGDKGLYKANLFDLADSPCFNGSQWVFIPNNGSGKFTINDTQHCSRSVNRIHWSFFVPGDNTYQFQFKYVDEKNKPLDAANRGYRSKIYDLKENSMEMRIETVYEGNPFQVVLVFTKVSSEIKL